MICKAVTKLKPGTQLLAEIPSKPCKYQATRDGYCRVHHPANLLPRLISKRERLKRALALAEEEVNRYNVEEGTGNPS